MLDLKFVRENLADVGKAVEKRGGSIDFAGFSVIEKRRREILQEIETLRNRRNIASDKIAEMKKAGEDAQSSIEDTRSVS